MNQFANPRSLRTTEKPVTYLTVSGIGCRVIGALCLISLAFPALAKTPQLASPVSAGDILRVFIGLIAVVATLFAVLWLFKRLGGTSGRGRGNMRILASLPLGHRERLLLVQVGGTQLVIGVTAQEVRLICRLEDPVTISDTASSNETAFMERLLNALQTGRAETDGTDKKKLATDHRSGDSRS